VATPDTNGTNDAFVRDLKTGTTTLVSINQAGTASGNRNSGDSGPGAITPDGRFVLFESNASDLVANDTNGTTDAFVRDLQTGTTTLVSINQVGTASGNGQSFPRGITPNGRFVMFESAATDLVTTPDNNGGVFVRDLKTGTTTLVTINQAGTASGNGGSGSTAITPNGRFVLFGSGATDLATTPDTNGTGDVFVRDLKTGTTTLVSINQAGTASGNATSGYSGITRNGLFVMFDSAATDLVTTPDTNGTYDTFVRDLQTRTTRLVSINQAGTASGNSNSGSVTITPNGRFVLFQSNASDLVANDTNSASDVFVRQLR
jgi:hypothetical protein